MWIFLGIVLVLFHIYNAWRIETMASQIEGLRAAIAELQAAIAAEGVELREKFDELTSKILDLNGRLVEAGEPDVDLTPEIEAIRGSISNIQGLSGQEEESIEDGSGT